MSGFFKPYEGGRPFVFVSYAHLQSDAVVGTIRILHERGWRLWYDEGIPAGSDWPANIARHMQSCERVIFFLSGRAMASPNCYSEISTAARLGKPILLVCLEDVTPSGDWAELLEGRDVIPFLDSPEARAGAILRSGFLRRRFHRSWTERIPWRALGLAASMLLFLASAGALGALATGAWQPIPEPETVRETPAPRVAPTPVPIVELGEAERYFAVSFPDQLQERAIRRALGNQTEEIYRWQLAEIRELYFCGNLAPDSLDAVSFTVDGTARVNGAPVIQGPVNDLSMISQMLRLERLALICQPLGDLAALGELPFLRELSLAGSTVRDLAGLSGLASLETLHLEHTAVSDLTPLEALTGLKTVTVSRDMLPLRWQESANYRVVLIKES